MMGPWLEGACYINLDRYIDIEGVQSLSKIKGQSERCYYLALGNKFVGFYQVVVIREAPNFKPVGSSRQAFCTENARYFCNFLSWVRSREWKIVGC